MYFQTDLVQTFLKIPPLDTIAMEVVSLEVTNLVTCIWVQRIIMAAHVYDLCVVFYLRMVVYLMQCLVTVFMFISVEGCR